MDDHDNDRREFAETFATGVSFTFGGVNPDDEAAGANSGSDSITLAPRRYYPPEPQEPQLVDLPRKKRFNSVPLWVVLSLYTMLLSLFIGILTWQMTYKAAKNATKTLTSTLQVKMMNETALGIESRLTSALMATRMNRALVHSGAYAVGTNAERNATNAAMLLDVVAHEGAYDCMQFYLFNNSATYEAFGLTEDGTRTWYRYYQEGANITGFAANTDGSVVPGGFSESYEYDAAVEHWTQVITDTKNAAAEAWTDVYMLFKEGWTSIATGWVDPKGTFVGVGTVDLATDFLSTMLTQNSRNIPYSNVLYVVNMHDVTQIVSTSDENIDVYIHSDNSNKTMDNRSGLLDMAGLALVDPRVASLNYKLASQSQTLSDMLGSSPWSQTTINVNGVSTMATVGRINTPGLNWAVLAFINNDDVNAKLTKNNRDSGGAVAGIVLASALISVGIALLIRRLMNKMTADIVLLSQFRFSEVLKRSNHGPGATVIDASRLTEFREAQESLRDLVTAFAGALKVHRSFPRSEKASGGS